MKPSNMVKIITVVIILIISLLAYSGPTPERPYVIFPLLPPILAIVLAIVTRQVLPALFAGIWIGALMATGYNPINATGQSLAWIVENITDSWNATIIVFNFVVGAFIGLLYASGSMHALAKAIGRKVRSAKGASFISWLLGIIIFFDDYTNTIIVGNASKPLTDRSRVSRELLSYIVDSTAAPVAGLAIVSTWIGYEVGLIQDAFDSLTEEVSEGILKVAPTIGSYAAWLSSVPFRFYSILAIILVLLVVLTRRHFGPMLKAEHRVVKNGKVLRDGAQPLMPTETVLGEPKPEKITPPWVFAVSVLALVIVTLLGMWYTGAGVAEWWTVPFGEALMNADSATALLWGSFIAYILALVFTLMYKSLSFSKAMEYTIRGMYLMVFANTVMVLAWCIKSAVDAVGTADFVVSAAVSARVSALVAPLVIFLASMFISFTTGTSWGTFGIMMPLAIPLAWKLALQQYPESLHMAYLVTYASIAAVFSGGIFGDHCSPISDTTIMSSMYSGADHIDHVSTQIPYAITAASIGIILYLLFAIGLTTPMVLLPMGIVLLVAAHFLLNRWYAKLAKLPPVVPNYVRKE